LDEIREGIDGIISKEEDTVAYIELCGHCMKGIECRGSFLWFSANLPRREKRGGLAEV